MTTRLSHPLLHIEMTTDDLEGAYQLLNGLFNAEKIEETFIMGSMDKIGFKLELAEQPWKDEPAKPFMFPAYTRPRPKTDERVSRLLYARVMVPDVEETCALLRRVFMLDDIRERYNKTEDGPFSKIIDIKLGGVVLRFCQPRDNGNDWDKYLKERGPGVTGLAFSVNELAKTLKTIGNAEISGLSAVPLDWDPLIGTEDTPDQMQMLYTINTAAKIGFDLEIWAENRSII